MNDDTESPREAAKRFRRIIANIDDRQTIEAVSKLIAELEAKADEEEKKPTSADQPSEQKP